jgi:hypothetical protein
MARGLVALLGATLIAAGIWSAHAFPALASLTPARHVTLVLGRPTRLDVSLYNFYTEIGHGSTEDRVMVGKIVNVINQADVPSPGAVACPALPGRHATLRFHYRDGDTWTVTFDGCWGLSTHGERGTALGDPPVYGTLPGLLDQVAGVTPAQW